MICSSTSRRKTSVATEESCCVDTTTVSMRTGRPSWYSTVTWVLPSGRKYGRLPDRRTSESRRTSRCAISIGIGINSGVSRQA